MEENHPMSHDFDPEKNTEAEPNDVGDSDGSEVSAGEDGVEGSVDKDSLKRVGPDPSDEDSAQVFRCCLTPFPSTEL